MDEVLMQVTGTTKRYLHANHLYSVAAVTDASGNVVERYRYDAYGRQTIMSAGGVTRTSSSVGNSVGFTGRTVDSETGLMYFRARMYSVTLGRFVGRDPKRYVNGMGLYGAYYVPNKLDPTGMTTIKCYVAYAVHGASWVAFGGSLLGFYLAADMPPHPAKVPAMVVAAAAVIGSAAAVIETAGEVIEKCKCPEDKPWRDSASNHIDSVSDTLDMMQSMIDAAADAITG